ncbi:recombinase family protein [Streptomyces cinerochromogenes]|uniref:recombinase family protein n=1 Tax=Streptomyces cinerochromogenes TaxID=66422 RepID=UPI0033BBF4C8
MTPVHSQWHGGPEHGYRKVWNAWTATWTRSPAPSSSSASHARAAVCRTNASSPSTTTPAATQRFPRSSPGPRSAPRPRLGARPRTDLAVGSALARAGDRIGYARVSSKGQDLAGQVLLLREAGCVWIHVEKVGTRKKIRPEYDAALADLRPADTPTSPCSTASAAT